MMNSSPIKEDLLVGAPSKDFVRYRTSSQKGYLSISGQSEMFVVGFFPHDGEDNMIREKIFLQMCSGYCDITVLFCEVSHL
jgi:hypothetical protein